MSNKTARHAAIQDYLGECDKYILESLKAQWAGSLSNANWCSKDTPEFIDWIDKTYLDLSEIGLI